jgi:pyruvate dehydrogenase E2 component (dihydrolipoamide acetyltransferase)
MTTSFRLPDLGEGVHEAEILALPVVIGQAVREGDIIMAIETDKAAVEIPSPFTGAVQEILVKVGDMARVGDVLMTFSPEATAGNVRPPERRWAESKAAPQEPKQEPHPPEQKGRPVPASPSTRRLARERGVDLHDVRPTGPGGIVTREDVAHHAEKKKAAEPAELAKPLPPQVNETPQAPQAPQSRQTSDSGAPRPPQPEHEARVLPDFSKWGEIERLPFRSIRRATARQMSRSWAEIPHVLCQDNVDITRLEAFRQRHRSDMEAAGGKLTMTIFAMKAVATALKNYPSFNASLDLQAQQIIIKRYFNLGIAVDTENGLMVPVIRDVDRKSIKELAVELTSATTRVRSGMHSPEEMQGGTFTITNTGPLGGSHFSAIINHPEVAILGLGQGRMQPAVVTDEGGRHEIVPRLLMPIVLCFDHRVVDGADALRFLRLVIDALEDPDELLITMI